MDRERVKTVSLFDRIEVSAIELMSDEEIDHIADDFNADSSKRKALPRLIDIARYLGGLSLKNVIVLRHQEMEAIP